MRWRGYRQSRNVKVRRGMRSPGIGGFSNRKSGLARLLPMLSSLIGLKGIVVIIIGIIGFGLYSVNLQDMLDDNGITDNQNILDDNGITNKQTRLDNNGITNKQTRLDNNGITNKQTRSDDSAITNKLKNIASGEENQSLEDKDLVEFISVVLADTEDTWAQMFGNINSVYEEPGLVIYRNSVDSGCGFSSSQMGPFYCPVDRNVYIDLGFYSDLKNRHGAPGDFAQAYVLAHEIGHHVQTITGISDKVNSVKKNLNKVEANRLSVRQELQADCYAGIWAHHANRSRQILESGDIEEALTAASAIGNDRLQKQTGRLITPETFTHGSSEQRMRWFKTGLEMGTLRNCDTYSAENL